MSEDQKPRHMTLEVSDSKIDVEVRVDKTFKAVKYELTSQNEITPLDACYCLWLIVKNICDEQGVSVFEFLATYNSCVSDDTGSVKNIIQ